MKSSHESRFLTWHVDACGAIVCSILLIVFVFGVIRPIMSQQTALAAIHDEITELNGRRTVLDQRTAQLRLELEGTHAALAATDLTLQPVEQVNRRLADIVELATECGMVIHQTQTDEPDHQASHNTVPVDMAGAGSYSECARFLHKLTTVLPDVKVIAFELSGKGKPGGGDGAFEFDLAWYAAPSVAHIDTTAP
jgi:Tfp pilus assembly protein PilO